MRFFSFFSRNAPDSYLSLSGKKLFSNFLIRSYKNINWKQHCKQMKENMKNYKPETIDEHDEHENPIPNILHEQMKIDVNEDLTQDENNPNIVWIPEATYLLAVRSKLFAQLFYGNTNTYKTT
jgi:hypothetical protein